MSSLHIVTNQNPADRGDTDPSLHHLGTRDHSIPDGFFDYPGKTDALVKAAYELRDATGEAAKGLAVTPISIEVSHRIPTRAQLLTAHPEEYLTRFEAAAREALARAQRGEDQWIDFGEDADVTAGTFRAAIRSVGTAFHAVDIALQAPDKTAFALVWPPGHHAEPTRAMGYCYLATAALAALYARDHAMQLRPGHRNRVVLIDIDHHQGNGSAAVLANNEGILFVDQYYRSPYDETTKQYTDREFDPSSGTYQGSVREYPYTNYDATIGCEPHTIVSGPNVLNLEFQGFQEPDTVISSFIERALPAIKHFQPDIVLWSVGLDSVKGDPIGGLGLAPDSFYTLIKGLRVALPDARHCGILEGGYHLELAPKALKPALLALHDDADSNLCESFARYRAAFLAGRG